MDSRVKHLVNCLILKYKCISENEAYQITKEIKEKKGTKFENLYDIDFLELAKPHVCNKLKDKSKLERKKDEERNDRNSLTCDFCYRVFYSKQTLARHLQNIHRKQGLPSKKSAEINQSFKVSNKKEQYICPICHNEYTHDVNLQMHMQKHQEKPLMYTCDICEKVFDRKSNLVKHRGRIHSLYIINFEKAHRNLSVENGQFQCDICGDRLKNGDTLDDHFSRKVCQRETNVVVNEEGKFQCTVCEKSYLDENSLTRHYNWKHKDPVLYKCDLCDKSFPYISSLKRHKIHVHKITA